jgi:hypothetical protein
VHWVYAETTEVLTPVIEAYKTTHLKLGQDNTGLTFGTIFSRRTTHNTNVSVAYRKLIILAKKQAPC